MVDFDKHDQGGEQDRPRPERQPADDAFAAGASQDTPYPGASPYPDAPGAGPGETGGDPYGSPFGAPYGTPYGTPPEARPGYDPYTEPAPASEETTAAILAHVLCWVGNIVTGVLGFIAPLVVLLTTGRRSRFARHHAANELNAFLTCVILTIVLSVLGALLIFPFVLILAMYVVYLVYAVIVTIAAANGRYARYPTWLAWPMVH